MESDAYSPAAQQNHPKDGGVFYVAASRQKVEGKGLNEKVLKEFEKRFARKPGVTWDQSDEWHDSGSYSDVSWQNSLP